MTHTSTEQPEALERLRQRLKFTHARHGHTARFVEATESDVKAVIDLADSLRARVQELEASQAQRVPLTDEEKQNLLKEWSYSQFTGNGDFLDGVEAAERAHGITQEKQV